MIDIDDVFRVLSRLETAWIKEPMMTLYLNGPCIHGFGFWEGKAVSDICAAIAQSTSASFWNDNTTTCLEIISKRFLSYYLLWKAACIILVLIITMQKVLYYITVTRPLLAIIEASSNTITNNSRAAQQIPLNCHYYIQQHGGDDS